MSAEDKDDDPQSGESASTMCMLQPTLYSIGFSVTFSALFAKTRKVHTLLVNTDLKVVRVTISSMILRFMVPVIVLNGTVLVIWAATDPLKYVRIILTVNPLNGMTASSAGLCQSESNSLPYMCTRHYPASATCVRKLSRVQNKNGGYKIPGEQVDCFCHGVLLRNSRTCPSRSCPRIGQSGGRLHRESWRRVS